MYPGTWYRLYCQPTAGEKLLITEPTRTTRIKYSLRIEENKMTHYCGFYFLSDKTNHSSLAMALIILLMIFLVSFSSFSSTRLESMHKTASGKETKAGKAKRCAII